MTAPSPSRTPPAAGSLGRTSVRPARLSENVADQITEYLIDQRLRPGDRLPTEPEIAELCGVSRTVVREASRLLVGRGVVDIRAGRGMVVAEFDGSSLARQYRLLLEMNQGTFQELMDLRLVLEVGVCRRAAAHRTPDDLANVQQALASFSPDAPHEVALEADLSFHLAIATAAHNPFFEHLVRPINRYLRQAYRHSMGYESARQQTADEHRGIADAIAAGDPDAASELMGLHLSRVLVDTSNLVGDTRKE